MLGACGCGFLVFFSFQAVHVVECAPHFAPGPDLCMIGLRTPDLEGSQLDKSERTEWNSKYSKIGLWFN